MKARLNLRTAYRTRNIINSQTLGKLIPNRDGVLQGQPPKEWRGWIFEDQILEYNEDSAEVGSMTLSLIDSRYADFVEKTSSLFGAQIQESAESQRGIVRIALIEGKSKQDESLETS